MRIPTFSQFQKQADLISQQYANLGKLQQQASSGKKLLSPSDDPVLANQLQSIQDYINQMGTYDGNAALIQQRNSLYNTTNNTISSLMTDIRAQLSKVQSGTIGADTKSQIASQLQSDLNALLAAANTTDQSGQFIFSGTNGASPAYARLGNSYVYQGGPDSTSINIGPDVSTLYNDIGSNVFGDIPTGNGTFMVSASGSNTGSAVMSSGAVTSQSAYVADTYTISVVLNNDGVPAIQVVDSGGTPIIPGSTAPAYDATKGQDVSFNGMTVHLGPGANLNDQFTVQPSTQQNVFDTLQGVIDAIKNPALSSTQLNQAMSQANASVSQIGNHFTSYQSVSGAREQTTNNQLQANANILLDQRTLQSNLGDADITQVFSSLMQQAMALQATQQSYLQIQNTLSSLLKL